VGRHEGSDYAAPLATSVCLRLAATLFDVQQDDVRIPETATTRWRPKACIHFQQTPSAASGFGEESRAMVRVREVTRLASFLSTSMLSPASRFSLAHNPRLSSVNTLTVHANF
jgi:hypothetical protein